MIIYRIYSIGTEQTQIQGKPTTQKAAEESLQTCFPLWFKWLRVKHRWGVKILNRPKDKSNHWDFTWAWLLGLWSQPENNVHPFLLNFGMMYKSSSSAAKSRLPPCPFDTRVKVWPEEGLTLERNKRISLNIAHAKFHLNYIQWSIKDNHI